MRGLISGLRFQVSGFAFAIATAIANSASFDTGLTPEGARDLLATAESPPVPAGSWLRLRGIERSTVRDDLGAEVPPWTTVKPTVSVGDRRTALSALRAHGYQLVAFVRWPADSWKNGVRPDQPLRRLPIDLREAHERARQLAATYGDLVDYWEIENEPDISSVEENPETYAAFLKACYLGFREGAESGKRKAAGVDYAPLPATGRVLAAAFALPPGPYFDAWVANDGLRYTDGFNYHYYGYAEDFTGVYRQFEQAVISAPAAATAGETVFQTRFYSFRTDWQVKVSAEFSADKTATAQNRALLQTRPLAVGEPELQEHGRWLVSTGTTVKETAEGWEFTVTGPAPGPLRPAMAELPLPESWSAPDDASLAFEYRVAGSDGGRPTTDNGPQKTEDTRQASTVTAPPPSAIHNQAGITYPSSDVRRPSSANFERKLPVFLTEYGYGLMSKEARWTLAGREAQRAWFAAVQPQIAALKIEGPMAFILQPYFEANKNEFGLLVERERGKGEEGSGAIQPTAGLKSLGNFTVSPALADLLAAGVPPAPRSWIVATPPPSSVVMDFVAGSGLQMSKSHRGYAMQADTGSAQLVVYHFGTEPISGELTLENSAWTLAGGGRTMQLNLAPGERREIAFTIQPSTDRYVAQSATARFRLDAVRREEARTKSEEGSEQRPGPLRDTQPPVPVSPQAPASAGVAFEVYLRTANGNLYQTWPRQRAGGSWQWYFESLANFTPAFFGRAYLPAALAENKPAALVFFFRPENYPATYLVRNAQVVEYVHKTGGK